MNRRKKKAITVLVGYQGQRIAAGSWNSCASPMVASAVHALQYHAPTIEQTMRTAGAREGMLLLDGTSDEQVSLDQAHEKWRLSRMQLECLGFLPWGVWGVTHG